MGDQDRARRFFRILEPGDPWTPEGLRDERIAGFHGNYPSVSVYEHTKDCRPLTALAAFYGARRQMGPAMPAFLEFAAVEVEEAGGSLQRTPAIPDWPPETSSVHHDIEGDTVQVAKHLVAIFERAPERRNEVSRDALLLAIAALDARPDAPRRFRKTAKWRFRRLFERERPVWETIAAAHPHLRDYNGPELRREEHERREARKTRRDERRPD